MVDLVPRVLRETVLGVNDVTKLPGSSKYRATVICWITRGVPTKNGKVVRLEGVRVGLLWKTSQEAFQRFIAELTAAGMHSDAEATEVIPELASV